MVKYTADDANGFQAEVITNGIARLHGHGSEDGAGASVDEQVQHDQGNEVNDEEEEDDDEEQGRGQHAQQHNEQEEEQEEEEEEQPHAAVQQQAREAPKKKGHYEVHEDHDEGEEEDDGEGEGEGEEGGGDHEEYEGSSEEGYVGYDDVSRHRQKEDAAEEDSSEEY